MIRHRVPAFAGLTALTLATAASAQMPITPTVMPAPMRPDERGAPGPKRAAPAKPTGPVGDFAGRYKGQFDGGNGFVTIKGTAPRYSVEVDVASAESGCSGTAKGVGTLKGATLTLAIKVDDGMCRITMTKSGNRMRVEESNCGYLHGASCAFDGTVRKVTK